MNKTILCIIIALCGLSVSSYAADKATLSDFMPAYAKVVSGQDIPGLLKLTDLSRINKRMTPEQMTDFMGNTLAQAKTIYGMYKSKDGLMTPREFCHYLSDTLFDSAAGAFVSKKQKSQLRQRMKVMDVADSKKLLSAAEISTLLQGFVIDDLSETTIKSVLYGIR